MVLYGIFVWCIAGFVRWVFYDVSATQTHSAVIHFAIYFLNRFAIIVQYKMDIFYELDEIWHVLCPEIR